MGYFATNVPSQRPVAPVQSVGFIYTSGFNADNKPTKPNTPCTNASIQTCSHSDALAEIDTWTGDPWQPSDGGSAEGMLQGRRRLGSGLGNWWTDFWNWLSNAVEQVIAFVQKVVVAIGDAVMVGINLIVDGIEQVFHCKIQFLEDIAAAIGSFFNMLEKVLSDVLEALSILFQFGEIIKTQKMLKAFLVDQLLNLENTINTKVAPAVQSQFNQGKDAIKAIFDNAIQSVPDQPISQQGAIANQPQTQGGFATPHTFATVKSAQDGSSSSQAVQSNYGIQKMKAGTPSATIASTYAQALGDDNPFVDFLTAFAQDVEQTISDNFSNLQSNLSANFSSASSFFDSILKDFLLILEDFIETGLDITQALLGNPGNPTAQPPVERQTGLLVDLFGDLINYLIGSDGNGGILGSEIKIPFITWLFELIFQEKLSVLNLVTFVVAIPVTVLFKVITGKYPSETTLPTALSTATVDDVGNPLDELWNLTQRTIAGISYALFSFIGGFTALASDAMDNVSPKTIAYLVCASALPLIPLSLPYATTGSPGMPDWTEFGLTVGSSLAGIAFAGLAVADTFDSTKLTNVSLGVTAFYSLVSLIFFCVFFGESGDLSKWANISFAAAFLSWINGIVPIFKVINPDLRPVVYVLELALPLTSGIMTSFDYVDSNVAITVQNYVTADDGYAVVLIQEQGGEPIVTLVDGTSSNPTTATYVNINPAKPLWCVQQKLDDHSTTIPICYLPADFFTPDNYFQAQPTVWCGFKGSGDSVLCQIE
jgi:hypothetical protein